MIVLAGAIALLSWIYLAFWRGSFWRAERLVAPSPPAHQPAVRVTAIVPARDEAGVVGRSVASLLKQSGVGISVILVDDGSSDGTAEVARRAAAESGHPERLIIITGQPLPPGWSGKLWAVEQGVQRVRELHADFYLLTDADIEHAPDSVATLAAIAARGPYDLASFMVMLHCGTFAERALIPAFVFFFFLLYPPAWIADRRRVTAGAAGGSILVRPQILERAGGIAAIRGEVIDDCALAKNVKRSGGSVWLGLSRETRSIRPYGSFAEIGRMISRSAFNQLRHSALLLFLSFFGMALAYLLPPLLVVFSHRLVPALLGAAAWILMSICYGPIIRFYRLNLLWSLALPLVALFYMGATFHSAWKYWLGRGGEWKGRVQDPARD
ncbi:MAG: glycosyltransferase [Acidobacteriia bacterium]|nr:glycosyltransferase [Terriglobia bacterium]